MVSEKSKIASPSVSNGVLSPYRSVSSWSDTVLTMYVASDQDEEDTFNENTPFETEADAVLDFTEDNPFGEF